MSGESLLTAGVLVAALGSTAPAPKVDVYAQCGFYHWASLTAARDAGDVEAVSRHLGELSALARRYAVAKRVSLDGAYAILRRSGRQVARREGANIVSVARAGRACLAVTRSAPTGAGSSG